MGGLDEEGIDRLLADTRRALESLRAGPDAPAATDMRDHARGTGTAADEQVVAVAGTGGRIEELWFDPRLLRLASQDLSEHIMEAVNAALDDLREQVRRDVPASVEPAVLAETVQRLQTESVRQMSRFSQSVAETVARISEAAGGAGRGRQ